MGLLNFQAAPVEPKLKNPSPRKSGTPIKGNKIGAARRRVDPASLVYGEQLFKSARNVEKEIVVCFYPFTTNFVRIDKEGKFAIHYNFIPPKVEAYKEIDDNIYENGINQFMVYHFLQNITFEYKEGIEYIIEINDQVESFGPFETVLEIRDVILKIVKEEYFAKKAQKLANLRADEAAEKLRKDELDNEQNRLTIELEAAGLGDNFQPDQHKISAQTAENSKITQIQSEEGEKEGKLYENVQENRKPTADFLGKDTKSLSFAEAISLQAEIIESEEAITSELEVIEEKPKTAAELWMEQFNKRE